MASSESGTGKLEPPCDKGFSFENPEEEEHCVTISKNATVFVGNMPYKMTWKELKEIFSQFGKVAYAKCVIDFLTRKRKGYGFVQFEEEADAYKALSAADSKLRYQGRTMRVSSANHRHFSRKADDKKIINKIDALESESKPDEDAAEDGSPMDIINDDCLIHILLFLDPMLRIQLERVSKAWRRCSAGAFKLQTHMTVRKQFKSFRVFTEHMLYKVLSRCGPKLTSLDVSPVSSVFGNKALEVIVGCCCCPSLEHLNLSGVGATNAGMEALTSTCRNLKTLDVASCLQLTEKGFRSIFQNCQRLEHLVCTKSRIAGKCFKFATSNFKRLDAAGCKALNEGVKEVHCTCPDLEYFDVSGCGALRSTNLGPVIESCSKLQVLYIGGIDCVTSHGEGPDHVIWKLANPVLLTRLRIDNSGLKDEDLVFLSTACPNLVELDISCNHLTDSSIAKLSSFSNLQVLNICHLFQITSSSLMATIQLGKLTILRAQGCNSLDDQLFEAMAIQCPLLEELDVAGVTSLTRKTLSSFVDVLSSHPHRNLTLYSCTNDFEKFLPVSGCPNMSIVLSYRRLYDSHMQWEHKACDNPHDLLMPAYLLDEVEDASSLPADLIEEYDEDMFETDEFLINDDPLEMELFDMT